MSEIEIKKIINQLQDHENRLQMLEDKQINMAKESQTRGSAIQSTDLVLSIVNKIGDCEESEVIQRKVLDKKNKKQKFYYVSI